MNTNIRKGIVHSTGIFLIFTEYLFLVSELK